MGRIILIIFSTVMLLDLSAQKEDYVWVGGRDRMVSNQVKNGVIIDFNEESPSFMGKPVGYNFHSYSACICDDEGKLLFYSNGCAVFDSSAQVIENGDSLNYNEWFEERWQGDCRRNGYPGTQDILILPQNDKTYRLISKVKRYNGFAFEDSISMHVSTVVVDDNRVVLTKKDSLLYTNGDLSVGYLTAIADQDNEGFYLLQPKVEDSVFICYYLDNEGIGRLGDQNTSSYFTKSRSSASGTARFSPDGTMYAYYNYHDGLHIYDFDRSTGKIDNHRKVVIHDDINMDNLWFGSVEWSADSRFIYTASSLELHQVDTWESDLQDGVRLIDVYDGTQNPFSTTFFLMALAPDCKIYMASTSSNSSYHVINNPNELGTGCNFVQNGIQLPQSSGMPSFPNHPRWRVDEEEKCDPTITSVFGESVYYRSELSVYPIPSSGVYTVEIPEQKAGVVHVMSIQGQILRSYDVSSSDKTIAIDISDMASGYYHIEYYPHKNKDRKVYTRQVVKVD